jgi:hypothetical protein
MCIFPFTHLSLIGKANRVHLDAQRGLAFLPLQGHEVNEPGRNGGVGVVDVSNPNNLTHILVQRLPDLTMRNALSLIGNPGPTHVYAFGTLSNKIYVYEIKLN